MTQKKAFISIGIACLAFTLFALLASKTEFHCEGQCSSGPYVIVQTTCGDRCHANIDKLTGLFR